MSNMLEVCCGLDSARWSAIWLYAAEPQDDLPSVSIRAKSQFSHIRVRVWAARYVLFGVNMCIRWPNTRHLYCYSTAY
jgi:hypothetical protein